MMESDDEYDAYYPVLDVEDIPFFTTKTQSPTASSHVLPSTPPKGDTPPTEPQIPSPPAIKSASSDTYSDYDLLEFTEEDYEFIDAQVLSALNPVAPKLERASESSDTLESSDPPPSPPTGGPAVDISIETNEESGSVNSTEEPPPSQDSEGEIPSPFKSFRSWNGTLAVTDLTAPAWCELQFDYGLRQRRSRTLEHRPASFLSARGRLIPVNREVAAVNDRITKKGKSVHKVLEREIHPEEKPIKVVIPEDRWALRLINMICSVDSLLNLGRCREMPVFGILHDQVIVGIIDEVERKPIPQATSVPSDIAAKRPQGKRSVPSTPTKTKSKRSRLSPPPDQPPITSFLHTVQRLEEVPGSEVPDIRMEQVRPATPPEMFAESISAALEPLSLKYRLHVSDTKTRKFPTLPVDEDTVPAKIQLMIYHSLLSGLLESASMSPTRLDFRKLWARLGLDPRRKLSRTFLAQAGMIPSEGVVPEESLKCLDDIVEAWQVAAEALKVDGIDDSLTVVYRTQPTKATQRKKAEDSIPIPSLSQQEAADIARAVKLSLEDTEESGEDEQLTKAIAESLKNVTSNPDDPSSSSFRHSPPRSVNGNGTPKASMLEDDPEFEWAIQQSLLEHLRKRSVKAEQSRRKSGGFVPRRRGWKKEGEDTDTDTEASGEPQGEGSAVIGEKVIKMDKAFLENRLTKVLEYWFGRRRPTGVGIHLTRRCMWCEYREGCEWREEKAVEALRSQQEKRRST